MIDVTVSIGVAGAAVVLVGFVLNQMKRLDRDDFWYDFLNAVGAGLLMLYAWLIGSWPFLVLNAVWTGVSVRDLFRRWSS